MEARTPSHGHPIKHTHTHVGERTNICPIRALNLMPTRLQLITEEIKFHVQHVNGEYKARIPQFSVVR